MEKLFKKVDTAFVSVDEMDKSVQWYGDCLGLELLWQDEYISVMGTEGETP